MASSPHKLLVLFLVLGFFGALALGDTIAAVGSITLGFGMNNNGTTITTFGNISINTSVIQARLTNCSSGFAAQSFADDGATTCVNISSLTTGMNTSVSLVCEVNLLALTQKKQNFTYANGLLITNTSCV